MHAYMHAYIHAYIRTYIHTYIHTYIQNYRHKYPTHPGTISRYVNRREGGGREREFDPW